MIGFLVYYKIITKNDLKRIKNSHFSIMANKIFNYKTINNISVIVMLFIIFSGMVISFFSKKGVFFLTACWLGWVIHYRFVKNLLLLIDEAET